MSNYSCAKRAADPSNEFAACRQHCGDDAKCMRVTPDVAIAGLCFSTANTLTRMVWKLNDIEHGETIAEVLRNARDQLEQMGKRHRVLADPEATEVVYESHPGAL